MEFSLLGSSATWAGTRGAASLFAGQTAMFVASCFRGGTDRRLGGDNSCAGRQAAAVKRRRAKLLSALAAPGSEWVRRSALRPGNGAVGY